MADMAGGNGLALVASPLLHPPPSSGADGAGWRGGGDVDTDRGGGIILGTVGARQGAGWAKHRSRRRDD